MTEVNTMKGKNTIFVFRYIHSCLFIARLKIQVEFKITETGKNDGHYVHVLIYILSLQFLISSQLLNWHGQSLRIKYYPLWWGQDYYGDLRL